MTGKPHAALARAGIGGGAKGRHFSARDASASVPPRVRFSMAYVALALLAGSYPLCTKRLVNLGSFSPSWGAGEWPFTFLAGAAVILLAASEFAFGVLRTTGRLVVLVSVPALGVLASALGVAGSAGDFVQFGRSFALCLYFLALVAAVGTLVDDKAKLRLFCQTLTLGAVVAALLSLVQAVGLGHITGLLNSVLTVNEYGPDAEMRMASLFDEPSHFGLFSALVSNMLVASEAVGDSWPLRPRANRAAVLVLMSGVMLSRSLLALGILLFGLGWSAVVAVRRRREARVLLLIAWVLLAATFGATIGRQLGGTWVGSWAGRASRIAANEDPSANWRWQSVEGGLQEFGRRPYFGIGFGNFRHSVATKTPIFAEMAGEKLRYIDSVVVQLMAETGAFGVISLGVFFVLLFVLLGRLSQRAAVAGCAGALAGARMLLWSGLVASMISSFGGFLGFLFWLPPTVAIATLNGSRATGASRASPASEHGGEA